MQCIVQNLSEYSPELLQSRVTTVANNFEDGRWELPLGASADLVRVIKSSGFLIKTTKINNLGSPGPLGASAILHRQPPAKRYRLLLLLYAMFRRPWMSKTQAI